MEYPASKVNIGTHRGGHGHKDAYIDIVCVICEDIAFSFNPYYDSVKTQRIQWGAWEVTPSVTALCQRCISHMFAIYSFFLGFLYLQWYCNPDINFIRR